MNPTDDDSAAAIPLFPTLGQEPICNTTSTPLSISEETNFHVHSRGSLPFAPQCRTPASQILPTPPSSVMHGAHSSDLFASPAPRRQRGAVAAAVGAHRIAVPPTPVKQRRTVHGAGPTRVSVNAAAGSLPLRGVRPPAAKFLRSETGGRKRSADAISQFSAMELDESVGSPLSISQPAFAHILFPSQPPAQSPIRRVHADPSSARSVYNPSSNAHVGLPHGLVHPTPDGLELSQADTEYSVLLARRILMDFREVRELGRGSFSRVLLYEEGSSGELVAVKVSPPLYNAEQLRRYRRERVALERARGMPHVVQLAAAWEEGRVPQLYLQLEYCPRGSVAIRAEKLREQHDVWPECEVIIFTLHMAIALDALHRASLAHVDFKPDNVLIDAHGGYKLTDFGCSVLLDESGRPRRDWGVGSASSPHSFLRPPMNCNHGISGCDVAGRATASADWSSPNNPAGQAVDFANNTQLSMASVDEGDCRYLCADMLNQKQFFKAGDMYSLGMSLYEIMSGEPLPRNGDAFLTLRRQVPVGVLTQRGYSSALISLVVALLREDPVTRPSARDVLVFLRPPADTLATIADAGRLTSWLGDAANSSDVQLRHAAALMEATTWLLQTTVESGKGKLMPPPPPPAGKDEEGEEEVVVSPSRASTPIDLLCTPRMPKDWR